jgi:hypothetical protein
MSKKVKKKTTKKRPTNLTLSVDSVEYLENLSEQMFGQRNLSLAVDFLVKQIRNKKIEIETN